MAHDMEGSVFQALDQLKIELPSWGFANTGTRFGKFTQPAAATKAHSCAPLRSAAGG